jgi:cytosine/adenosine deaminase-related metal-dependent hydrolase
MTEYLITNGLVVTMDPERRVIFEGAVAVEDNKILAVARAELGRLDSFKSLNTSTWSLR